MQKYKQMFLTISIVMLIVLVAYLKPIIQNHNLLLYWGDEIDQILPFYNQLWILIHEGNLHFWNSSIGLGSNVFVTSIVSWFSPFTWIILLFDKKMIPFMFIWIDVVRFFLISIFGYLWLSKISNKYFSATVGTFMLAFSSYVLCWLHFGSFLDAYVVMIIILNFLEDAIKGKNYIQFSLSIFFLVLVNPYFLYIFSWYIILYIFLRIHQLERKKNLLSILVFYLLGISLSAFLLIPFIEILKTSPRLNIFFTKDDFFNIDIFTIIKNISAYLSPVVTDYTTNLYVYRDFSSSHILTPYFFSLIIGVYTIFLSIISINPQKWRNICCLLVLFILQFMPISNYILNGSLDMRWSFMVSFTMVIITVQTFDFIDSIKWKHLFINLTLLISIFGIVSIYSRKFGLYNIEFKSDIIHYSIFFIFVVIVYTFILKNKSSSTKNSLIIFTLSIESLYYLNIRMYYNGIPKYETFDGFTKYYNNEIIEKELSNIELNDSTFFRIDVNGTNSNYQVQNNFSGFQMYLSLYNHELFTYNRLRFSETGKIEYSPSKNLLKVLLGSKYYISNDDIIPYEYLRIKPNVGISKLNSSLGFATNKLYSSDYLENMDIFIQDLNMYNGIFVDESTSNYQLNKLIPVGKKLVNGSLAYEYKSDGYFVIDYSRTNPYTSCRTEYTMNGEAKYINEKYEYGYQTVPYLKDANRVYFYCSSIYNSNEYVPVNVYEINYNDIDSLFYEYNNNDLLTNVKYFGDKITANIEVSNDYSKVFTTIPYDKGWNVYIDDIRVKKEKINVGFLGFSIEKGKHRIELIYSPPGFKFGLGITSISFLLMTLWYIYKKKVRN